MRVLHLISSGGMYGAEAVILQLMTEMNGAEGDAASLALFSHSAVEAPELHKVARSAGFLSELVPCRGQVDLSVTRKLQALVARTQADVIHAHGYKADIYAFAAFRGQGRPALVSTCHTWYDNDFAVRLYGAADRWVLRSFDEVVAVSTDVRERLLGAGVRPENAHIIRNGLRLAAAPERPPIRNGQVRIGLVGRLAPEKGIDVFLRAIAEIVDAFPGATFTVAGDGPERPTLEALIRTLRLDTRAVLVGQQTDMASFYRSLDLLVSSSRHEGLPMALLEGMGSGLPVVATTVGEVPQVVVNGETGLLVPPNSPSALAGAMRQMLSNPELLDRFGKAGRARIADHFSAERMCAEYRNVYRSAISRLPRSQNLTETTRSA